MCLRRTIFDCGNKIRRKKSVRVGVVKKAWRWEWSSAGVHVGQKKETICLEDITNLIDVTVESWKEYIDSDESEEDVKAIRINTMLGRPLGTNTFMMKLSKKVGRILKVKPRGRPKKESKWETTVSIRSFCSITLS